MVYKQRVALRNGSLKIDVARAREIIDEAIERKQQLGDAMTAERMADNQNSEKGILLKSPHV